MIGIITLYYSENCGSVLQAGALRYALGQLGYPAVFVRTRSAQSSHSLRRLLSSAGTHLVHLDIANVKSSLSRYRNFSRTLKSFDSVDPDRLREAGISALVLGSDTVWDVTSEFFGAMPQLFWPRNLGGLKAIAYAPSAANATLAQLKDLGYPAQCLNTLYAVSARDEHTQQIVKALSGRDAPLVLDPTLLADEGFYRQYLRPLPQKNYLLVYWYERQEQPVIQAIRGYARDNGLSLVSMGRRRKWCDGYADASLENFVSYFHGASAVVTNTFHGTIFSIINRVPFVCLGGGKKKIAQLLPAIALEGRMAGDAQALARLLRTPVDYAAVQPRLSELREASLAYLKDALGNS